MGGLRRAASAPPTSPCMSCCPRSTGASSHARFRSSRRRGAASGWSSRGSLMRRSTIASPVSPIWPARGLVCVERRALTRALACVLSDYPAKGGRVGYAVGLDTPRSVAAIGEALREAGYDIGALPPEADLIAHLSRGAGATRPVGRAIQGRVRRAARGLRGARFRGLGRRGGRSGGARAARFISAFVRRGQADRRGAARSRATARRARANIMTSISRRVTPMSRSTSGCARSSASTR